MIPMPAVFTVKRIDIYTLGRYCRSSFPILSILITSRLSLFSIHFKRERQETEKAERAGRLSERSLKRNSLEAVRDLPARSRSVLRQRRWPARP